MATNRDLVERFISTLERREWKDWAALLDPDVDYVLPQTRERIRGRDRYLQCNQDFPADWHLSLKVAIADDSIGVAWFLWRIGDTEPDDAVAFFAFAGGLITTVTDFWPEPYDPPAGSEHLVERW
jgi:hypothetical protein